MSRVRRRAAAVLSGLAAAAAAVLLDTPPTAAVAIPALYAGAGYYVAAHPDVVWGRSRPDWTAGALGGGLTFGLLGLVNADAPPWLLLFGFGFVVFGFATGVAYGRESRETGDATA